MTLTIDIISDVVCPWCFIGKRRLETALAALQGDHPDITPTIRWLPYQLNPDTPVEGDAYRPFLEKKFGGPEALQAIWARVTEAGKSAGIAFAFEKIDIRPNTLRAHRLLHRAEALGTAESWVERLFVGHFQRGEDIGHIDTLCTIATELGEDAGSLRAYLESEQDQAEVEALIARAQSMGISGVPFFIFNGKLAVSGAQTPEVLRQAIDEALKA